MALNRLALVVFATTWQKHEEECDDFANILTSTHEESNSKERYEQIAKANTASPQGTLVVSPDNESRQQLNTAIRSEMRKQGILSKEAYGRWCINSWGGFSGKVAR